MVPPVTEQNAVALDAPIAQWKVTLTLDTSKECQDMIVKLRKQVTEGTYIPNFDSVARAGRVPLSKDEFMKRAFNQQCVASDDPRLKEKPSN